MMLILSYDGGGFCPTCLPLSTTSPSPLTEKVTLSTSMA